MIKKARQQRHFFQNSDNLYIKVFFVNSESALRVAFVKYTWSKFFSHCTHNGNFKLFRTCFVAKFCGCSILRSVYLFCPKGSKNGSRKPFVKKLRWASYLMFCHDLLTPWFNVRYSPCPRVTLHHCHVHSTLGMDHSVHIIFRLIFMTWF